MEQAYDLDAWETYERLDPQGMTASILNFPEQVRQARQIGKQVALPDILGGANSIVAVGMGGSAIGSDLLRTAGEDEFAIPFHVHRGYDLPAFVGRNTLVVVSSYSGSTEETLSSYHQAQHREAKVLAITTGGRLAELAQSQGVPAIIIPSGYMPRAAVGYSFFPLLTAMERLGYLSDRDAEVEEVIAVTAEGVRQMHPEVPETGNLAKQLARSLVDHLPLIYGSAGWSGIVAARWKGQFNENSKHVAYYNVLPELNHNELESWKMPLNVIRHIYLIVLRDKNDSDRINKQIEVTEELMRPFISGITDIWSRGESRLARLFSLLQVGDFVSLYLAMFNRVNPTAMYNINYLKGCMT